MGKLKPEQTGRKLTNEDIAFAMEMKKEGVLYKVIAYAFSMPVSALYNQIRLAKKNGMKGER